MNNTARMPRDREGLIDTLKSRPAVIGILQYGSAGEELGADIDLCVVVKRRPGGLESAHFRLGDGTPVDLNIRTLPELRTGSVAPSVVNVLRQGEVLYEKEPGLLAGLDIPLKMRTLMEEPGAISFYRFIFPHELIKLEHYKNKDPLLCHLVACDAVSRLIHAYAGIRGEEYHGERQVLTLMRKHDPDILDDVEKISGGCELQERIDALRRVSERVLAPIGGPWREDEVLFFTVGGEHITPRSVWRRFFDALVAQDRSSASRGAISSNHTNRS